VAGYYRLTLSSWPSTSLIGSFILATYDLGEIIAITILHTLREFEYPSFDSNPVLISPLPAFEMELVTAEESWTPVNQVTIVLKRH